MPAKPTPRTAKPAPRRTAAAPAQKTATPKYKAMPTAKGVFEYPWLCQPDTKFDPEGKYKCTIVCPLDDPNSRALIDLIDEINTGSYYPYTIDEDNNTVSFIAKSGAEYPPKLYDAKNNKLDPEGMSIWSGTVGRLQVKPNPYPNMGGGVNLYLCAAQIIELVAGSDCPFDEEEGFVDGGSDDKEDGDAPFDNEDADSLPVSPAKGDF